MTTTNFHHKLPPAGKLFFNQTPQELHRELVWMKESCTLCGGRPVSIEARIYLPQDNLRQEDPLGLISGVYGKPVRMFDAKKMGGKYHFVRNLFGCVRCEKALEKIVAQGTGLGAGGGKLHSSAYVMWDRGVLPTKTVVSVNQAR